MTEYVDSINKQYHTSTVVTHKWTVKSDVEMKSYGELKCENIQTFIDLITPNLQTDFDESKVSNSGKGAFLKDEEWPDGKKKYTYDNPFAFVFFSYVEIIDEQHT